MGAVLGIRSLIQNARTSTPGIILQKLTAGLYSETVNAVCVCVLSFKIEKFLNIKYMWHPLSIF